MYIKPSVLVYQDLVNAGGVANTTPDLEACIIGPTYNILSYIPGNTSSQVKTAAHSALTTTGSITSGSFNLTVASTGGFSVDDSILVLGAGDSAGTLQANISGISGNVITLDTAAKSSVVDANITKTGKISDGSITNTFTIAGAKPGQVVDAASVRVTLNNSKIETLTSGFTVEPLSNVITMKSATTTGGITTGLSSLVVASASGLFIGDTITVAGAGSAGAVLTAKITNVVGTTITVTPAAGTTVAAAAVAKVIPANLNATTNTLRAEPGDDVKFAYTNSGTGLTVFTSQIKSIVTSSGLNGTITSFNLVDSLPALATSAEAVSVSVRKGYNNQDLLLTKPISGGSNYTTADIGTTGEVVLVAGVETIYGPVVSGEVFISYRALRTDLAGQVLAINNITDLVGQLGELSDENPLALAVQLALANTTGRIRAIAVSSLDLAGHQDALTTAEGERVYFLVPLTQDKSIIAAYKAHCVQLSTPEQAAWRITMANTAIALEENKGPYSVDYVNANSGNNAVTLINGKYVLTASNATFIADGVAPGDLVHFTASSVSGQVGAHEIAEVVSNQQVVLNTTATSTANSYYVTRTMSKSQSAASVASTSETFNTNRVVHVQPDLVGVSVYGATKYLPGYYLAAALAGMGAGFPVQQGFTNIGVAGISDLKHSTFYFSRTDLGTMASAGTLLFAQDSQGGLAYCRHELTTDMSTLEYRELLKVKNWDFLSYYYYDKLKSFIGSWNITADSISIIRQTIIAASELVKSKKLPKIGAPLVGYTVNSVAQNKVNKDNLDVSLSIAIVDPMNYINMHLVI